MQVTQNDVTQSFVADTYDRSTASIDITGLAKGTYTVTWILSCFNEDFEVTMTSSIKSITIT